VACVVEADSANAWPTSLTRWPSDSLVSAVEASVSLRAWSCALMRAARSSGCSSWTLRDSETDSYTLVAGWT
jgi:hypothetical protein